MLDPGLWKVKERLGDDAFEYYHRPFFEVVVAWEPVFRMKMGRDFVGLWFLFFWRWFYFSFLLWLWQLGVHISVIMVRMLNAACMKRAGPVHFWFFLDWLVLEIWWMDQIVFLWLYLDESWTLGTNMHGISTKCNFVSLRMI